MHESIAPNQRVRPKAETPGPGVPKNANARRGSTGQLIVQLGAPAPLHFNLARASVRHVLQLGDLRRCRARGVGLGTLFEDHRLRTAMFRGR